MYGKGDNIFGSTMDELIILDHEFDEALVWKGQLPDRLANISWEAVEVEDVLGDEARW